MMLPDMDQIPSLTASEGMYSLSRWGKTVAEQATFLNAVAEKYGQQARVSLVAPYDGYPGYIRVER